MQTVSYIASTRRHFCRQKGCFVHTKCRKTRLIVADAAKNRLQPLSTKPFAFAYRRRKAQTAVVGLRKVRHYPAAGRAHRRANNILAYRRSAKRQVLSQNSRKVHKPYVAVAARRAVRFAYWTNRYILFFAPFRVDRSILVCIFAGGAVY